MSTNPETDRTNPEAIVPGPARDRANTVLDGWTAAETVISAMGVNKVTKLITQPQTPEHVPHNQSPVDNVQRLTRAATEMAVAGVKS